MRYFSAVSGPVLIISQRLTPSSTLGYSKIENCRVIQNKLDHQHFSNLMKLQLNVLWCAISHTVYMQTKFYSEPFMSGASPLEMGVGGMALAFCVSLFC